MNRHEGLTLDEFCRVHARVLRCSKSTLKQTLGNLGVLTETPEGAVVRDPSKALRLLESEAPWALTVEAVSLDEFVNELVVPLLGEDVVPGVLRAVDETGALASHPELPDVRLVKPRVLVESAKPPEVVLLDACSPRVPGFLLGGTCVRLQVTSAATKRGVTECVSVEVVLVRTGSAWWTADVLVTGRLEAGLASVCRKADVPYDWKSVDVRTPELSAVVDAVLEASRAALSAPPLRPHCVLVLLSEMESTAGVCDVVAETGTGVLRLSWEEVPPQAAVRAMLSVVRVAGGEAGRLQCTARAG